MNWKRIDSTLCGTICLMLGWGCGTLLHELCHLMTARSLGLIATPGRCTLATGSIVVHSNMTNIETALVAVAGSVGLILAGLILLKHSSRYLNMIGVVFLCRAWTDALPLRDLDGAMIAGSAGTVIAWGIVIAEILICGGAIWGTMDRNKVRKTYDI
jgi:hypothetical protein